VSVVEVKDVTTTGTNHQCHAVAGESPPAVLAGLFLLKLRAMAKGASELRRCHSDHDIAVPQADRTIRFIKAL
jgi:hypothetical protein